MESIIIMVLLAVASSVFQSVMQRNKQQAKEPDKTAPPVKPTIQPAVKLEKAKTFPKMETAKSLAQTPKAKVQPAKAGWESEGLMEGVQTEALDDIVILEQLNASARAEESSFIQNLTLDDLQKSIIMAEVLGKPKALKRNTR